MSESASDVNAQLRSGHPPTDGATVDREGYETLLDLLVSEGREQINAQLSNADAQSAKSLGIVAADLAGIALVVASRNALNRFWLATVVGLAISAACLFAPIVARSMADGPDILKFYEDHLGADTIAAKYEMYRAMLTSLAVNSEVLRGWRDLLFKVGVAALVVTAMGTAVYLPVVG